MKQQIKRFLRYLRGQDIYPRIDLKCPTQYLGNPGAAWTFDPSPLTSSSIVYCVGIGEDISFDLALQQRFGMEIHAFDPTPKSLNWVRQQALPDGYHVHELGLANLDGVVTFQAPMNPNFVSHKIVQNSMPSGNSSGQVRAEVRRLDSLCAQLGHTHVDLLKMDIEGAEYDVIEDLQRSSVRPLQLLVEFHHRQPELGIGRTKQALTTLRALGYQLFHVSANGEEYAFQRI